MYVICVPASIDPCRRRLLQDVELLHAALQINLQTLSSWDVYKAELDSTHLEWSPCHKSDHFWKDNHKSFEAGGCVIVVKVDPRGYSYHHASEVPPHPNPNPNPNPTATTMRRRCRTRRARHPSKRCSLRTVDRTVSPNACPLQPPASPSL